MGCGASAVTETEALGRMEMQGVDPQQKDAELERLWNIYDKGDTFTQHTLNSIPARPERRH